MSSDLSRQSMYSCFYFWTTCFLENINFIAAKTLTKKTMVNPDENEENSNSDNDDNDKENVIRNQMDTVFNLSPKNKQKVRKRRNVATITKNPDTLNARLDTHLLVDPFFAKLNSMVGDINSSKRLMQNIIPTKQANLKLRQNVLLWDGHIAIAADLDEALNYKTMNPDEVVSILSTATNLESLVIRTGLKNYRICDMPMESVENSCVRQAEDMVTADVNETLINRNVSNMDLQFDINAEVEPISNERSFVMDFGEMNDLDFDDIDDEQRHSLNRCRGLKRQPILIEDMQPETSATLSDYAYRPLDSIDQFWAGPSYWKYRYSRTNLSSIDSRSSFQTSNVSEVKTSQQRTKGIRKKKTICCTDVSFEETFNADDDGDALYVQKGKSKSTQINVQIMSKRWDSKKLKLPMDHHIFSDMFDVFSHSLAIPINTNLDATFTGNDNGDTYNYDNDLDRNYCSRMDNQSDTETETNTDIGQMDNNVELDMLPPPLIPLQLDEIPDFFIGAPDRIEKISIAFARRAKVIDMKQLKQSSYNLINQKNVLNPLQRPCFSEILRDLPKTLNRIMAENMSMPLAFYAILHLCNDKGMILTQKDSLEDFEITFAN